jgi:hypothetical protein
MPPPGAGGDPGVADPTVRMPAAVGSGPPPPGPPPPTGDGGRGDGESNAKWWWIAAIAILAIAIIVLAIVLIAGGDDDDTSTTTSSSSSTSTSTSTTSTTAPPTTTAAPPTTAPPAPNPEITGFSGPASVSCTSDTTIQLAWSTQNASRTTISIDDGGVFAEYGPSGTENVPFACTGDGHTYTLTAIGADNRRTTSRITVAQAPGDN